MNLTPTMQKAVNAMKIAKPSLSTLQNQTFAGRRTKSLAINKINKKPASTVKKLSMDSHLKIGTA